MENSINLPYADLKKFGIMTNENLFTPRLSKQEVDNFLKGSTLVAEDEANRLTFKLTKDTSKLEVNVYNKDIVNHKDLSSSELYEVALSKDSLYKPMADYGTIVSSGKTHFNQNTQNEVTHYVEIQNERGKTVFYGNDLEEKLKNFKVGDSIQVKNIGIEKSTISAMGEDGLKEFNKYNNLFSVKPLAEDIKETKSKLFEYDTKTKTIVDLDTSDLKFDKVNGITLTPEQIRNLKLGKVVSLDDDINIQLSPKADNEAKIRANTRNLLLASMALDGGLSFLIIKSVERIKSMILKDEKQKESSLYQNELEKMKSFLLTKSAQYPNDKKIVDNLNIIGKELSSVSAGGASLSTQEKNNGKVRLNVNDPDVFQDANREKERKNDLEQTEEQTMSRGRTR